MSLQYHSAKFCTVLSVCNIFQLNKSIILCCHHHPDQFLLEKDINGQFEAGMAPKPFSSVVSVFHNDHNSIDVVCIVCHFFRKISFIYVIIKTSSLPLWCAIATSIVVSLQAGFAKPSVQLWSLTFDVIRIYLKWQLTRVSVVNNEGDVMVRILNMM